LIYLSNNPSMYIDYHPPNCHDDPAMSWGWKTRVVWKVAILGVYVSWGDGIAWYCMCIYIYVYMYV
jgi:hypothetical protein